MDQFHKIAESIVVGEVKIVEQLNLSTPELYGEIARSDDGKSIELEIKGKFRAKKSLDDIIQKLESTFKEIV